MKIRTLLACAAALAMPLAATALPADAKPTSDTTYRQPEIAWVKNAKAAGDRATVKAKYRCWGGEAGSHLWVSLKQGGEINNYTADQLSGMEGTSALAKAWYDNNPLGELTVDCDGKWHVQRYTLAREPGKDALVKGPAFLQFCLYDSRFNPTADPDHDGFDYEYKFIRVKAKKVHHS